MYIILLKVALINVTLPSVILIKAILPNVAQLSVILINAVLLHVIHFDQYNSAYGHSAKCRSAECFSAVFNCT